MKKLLVIAAIFVILIMSGCKSESKKELFEFPTSSIISFDEVNIPNILGMPQEIAIHKNKVLVCDQETDWLFKVFSLEYFDYLGSMLRRGRGPEEEINIVPILRPYSENAILYQGTSSIKIVKIQTHLERPKLEVIHEFKLPTEMLNDADVFKLNGKLYSSYGLASERDFQGFCIETGKLFEWGESLPLSKSQISTLKEKQFPLFKATTVKPDKKLLATVYNLLPIIRVYDAENGRLIREMHKTDASKNIHLLFNSFDNPIQEELANYYLRIKSTNEYIYALYSGKPIGGKPEYNVIHIWDWDGNPVMELNFDISMAAFDVSPDNKHIVALPMFESDKILRGKIPSLEK